MKRGASLSRLVSGDRPLWGFVFLATALVLAGVGYSSARAAAERNAAPQEAARETPTLVTPSVLPHRIIAYYFHTTYRCASCRAIEAYSHEAIAKAFADELKDGRIVWNVVNVEIKGNEHFVKDYGLYTKSLVLVNEVRGKRTEWKNLEKVWQLLQDKERFLRYVQDETRAYLTSRT
ncbi:MAG: nitrophenyl compound nitroreductase subunit ArsF family protein [Acidobacteriota bacterium]